MFSQLRESTALSDTRPYRGVVEVAKMVKDNYSPTRRQRVFKLLEEEAQIIEFQIIENFRYHDQVELAAWELSRKRRQPQRNVSALARSAASFRQGRG